MQEEELVYTPGYKIREMILSREISCQEVTQTFLKRIHRLNPQLNAYILILEELALNQAEKIDHDIGAYKDLSLLGIPISIKDLLLNIQNYVTTNGSLVCKAIIADNDSLSVKRLRNSGAIFLGKTNVPEFGSDFLTQNMLMPPTANPWNILRTSGGSSGGAASSVSAGLATMALANDSAGSIRLPSGLCSLFGYMPSAASIPTIAKEELAFQPLHRIGPISHNVRDAALMLNVLNQPTALDPTQTKPIDFVKLLDKDPKKLKFAFSPDLGLGIQNEETLTIIRCRLKEIEALGFEIEETSLPIDLKEHLEELSNFIIGRFTFLTEEIPLVTRPLLGSSILTLLQKAKRITEADLLKAKKFRDRFKKEMDVFMQSYDLILTPTSVFPALPIKDFRSEVKKHYFDPFVLFAFLLYPFNMTGQPAASLPCGFNCENLPIGLQIVGRENGDSVIFQFCGFYERAFPWINRRPQLDQIT
jgi:Asp-tRNA(Asn)/Glu-tRNA(Gln) amidotransferase A subunit family amidase